MEKMSPEEIIDFISNRADVSKEEAKDVLNAFVSGPVKKLKLSADDLRNLYLNFYKSNNHNIIAPASLIPENDPTVLFTTAGMQPLVPYLLGEHHPSGNRLVNIQRCVRTVDIEEVGDASHLTCFEMMGCWSLGDYWKQEIIKMSFEFLTSEKYLGLPKEKLYFTVFEGDAEVERDNESYEAWLEAGVEKDHLCFLPRKNNFWMLGSGVGPCGPDTEMFYDTETPPCGENCHPGCDCPKYMEVGNDVFLQYRRDENGLYSPLSLKCVDQGMGFERNLIAVNGVESIYDTDLFVNSRIKLEELSKLRYDDNKKDFRIIMDHLRTATFILGDNNGVTPSNTNQGYILRRLLRRAIRLTKKLNITDEGLIEIVKVIIKDYEVSYREVRRKADFICEEILKEAIKFSKTLKDGERLFYKVIKYAKDNLISGSDAFKLFDTFGFPLEMTIELATENGFKVDTEGFYNKFKEHQEKSKTIDAGSFKGGLADDSYETTKYHTVAHLMLAALQKIYGKDIVQKGCNITSERIRFDFNLDHKMSDEEKVEFTKLVNEYINTNTDVICNEMSYESAKELGAHGTFEDKYGEVVKVYEIGNISKEICGGPHVKNTSEIGKFTIVKEESSSFGVRRIKAIIE